MCLAGVDSYCPSINVQSAPVHNSTELGLQVLLFAKGFVGFLKNYTITSSSHSWKRSERSSCLSLTWGLTRLSNFSTVGSFSLIWTPRGPPDRSHCQEVFPYACLILYPVALALASIPTQPIQRLNDHSCNSFSKQLLSPTLCLSELQSLYKIRVIISPNLLSCWEY